MKEILYNLAYRVIYEDGPVEDEDILGSLVDFYQDENDEESVQIILDAPEDMLEEVYYKALDTYERNGKDSKAMLEATNNKLKIKNILIEHAKQNDKLNTLVESTYPLRYLYADDDFTQEIVPQEQTKIFDAKAYVRKTLDKRYQVALLDIVEYIRGLGYASEVGNSTIFVLPNKAAYDDVVEYADAVIKANKHMQGGDA